ncbi:hypothetical protein M5689_002414 [Euphorbia peplus]|nr:hypothetical protein M5689_002414 [Euphorbia peplus]
MAPPKVVSPPKIVSLQSCALRTPKSVDSVSVEYVLVSGLVDLSKNQYNNIMVATQHNYHFDINDFYDEKVDVDVDNKIDDKVDHECFVDDNVAFCADDVNDDDFVDYDDAYVQVENEAPVC